MKDRHTFRTAIQLRAGFLDTDQINEMTRASYQLLNKVVTQGILEYPSHDGISPPRKVDCAPRERIAAAKEILDRFEGKAIQRIDVKDERQAELTKTEAMRIMHEVFGDAGALGPSTAS